MKNQKFKPWKVKILAMWNLLFSKNYALINFVRTGKDKGYIEGFFSKGFKPIQIDDLLTSAQLTHNENIITDNYDSILKEANQLLTK